MIKVHRIFNLFVTLYFNMLNDTTPYWFCIP